MKYICKGCGTVYGSNTDEAPRGIKWSDGHVCKPVINNNK